ncbi:MAG TPA: hypothetical protein VKF41_03835 [Bryobacteraceae bacterium]|nr:hypothetical protein [Bryobacteraceae bacterium]
MAQNVSMIGINANELRWIRTLVQLLRHPDPSVPELTRQALLYMAEAAGRAAVPPAPTPSRTSADTMDFAG